MWTFAGLSLVGTLLCGALAGYEFWVNHRLATDGVTTTALVTEVDGDDVTLKFITDIGQPVTTEILWMPSDVPAADDTVKVTYDPDDVNTVVPEGSDEDRVMALILTAVAGVALLVSVGTATGAIFVHRARSRNAKAARAGPA